LGQYRLRSFGIVSRSGVQLVRDSSPVRACRVASKPDNSLGVLRGSDYRSTAFRLGGAAQAAQLSGASEPGFTPPVAPDYLPGGPDAIS
jgi:hypothetical protein